MLVTMSAAVAGAEPVRHYGAVSPDQEDEFTKVARGTYRNAAGSEHLTEEALARELGVPRSTLRDAAEANSDVLLRVTRPGRNPRHLIRRTDVPAYRAHFSGDAPKEVSAGDELVLTLIEELTAERGCLLAEVDALKDRCAQLHATVSDLNEALAAQGRVVERLNGQLAQGT